MSLSTLQSYASHALSCTEKMYTLAEQQDWEALEELETERSQLLDTLFSHPALPGMLSKLANTIRLIIELDQKTISLGKNARNALKNEMRLLVQGKKAVDAYLDSSRHQ